MNEPTLSHVPAESAEEPTDPTPRRRRRATAEQRVALGVLDVQRAQAALWLLEQMDDQMGFDRDDPAEVEREGWCRAICKDAIRDSLAAAEKKIQSAMKQADAKGVA